MYPLWLCPFKLYDQPGMVHPAQRGDQMYVDIGAYGSPKSSSWEAVKTTRALEAYVIKVNGYVFSHLHKPRVWFAYSHLPLSGFSQWLQDLPWDSTWHPIKLHSVVSQLYFKWFTANFCLNNIILFNILGILYTNIFFLA